LAIFDYSSCTVYLLASRSVVLPRIRIAKNSLLGSFPVQCYFTTHVIMSQSFSLTTFLLTVIGVVLLLGILPPTALGAPLYLNDVDVDYLVGGDLSMIIASTTNPWTNGEFGAIQIYLGALASTSVEFHLYEGTNESNHKDCSSGQTSVVDYGAPVDPGLVYGDLVLVTIPMYGTECFLTAETGGFDEDNSAQEVVGAQFSMVGSPTSSPRYIKVLGGSAYNYDCDTCTRIVDIISPLVEYVYFITPDVSFEYYVNSDDVTNPDNVYIEFYYNSVKSVAYAQSDATNYSGAVDEQINIFDSTYFFNSFISDLTATGTYSASVLIYERVDPPWWQFWTTAFTKKTLTKEDYRFHIYTETDAQEIAFLYEAEQAKIEQNITPCFDSYTSNECLKYRFEELANAVIYAPPLGYGAYLVNMLISTTTSSTPIEMTLTFSSTSPAYGASLNLNASAGLEASIASLRAMDIPTMDNNPFDQFMLYWNRIWYILLAFYILRRIYGTFDINLGAGNYQKSGSINGVGSVHEGSRGSTGLKITSYD